MSTYSQRVLMITLLACFFGLTCSKIHHMTFKNDKRLFIHLLDFGFLPGSVLKVKISNFSSTFEKFAQGQSVGFTLNRGDEVNELLKAPGDCILNFDDALTDVVFMPFDFSGRKLKINRVGSSSSKELIFCSKIDFKNDSMNNDNKICYEKIGQPNFDKNGNFTNELDYVAKSKNLAPIESVKLESDEYGFSTEFEVDFLRRSDEGQYSLIFHNCRNYGVDVRNQVAVEFTITLVAKNDKSYLSAGEIIYPPVYFALAVLFFATGIFWIAILNSTKENVHKIHYLMAALVFLKCLTLLFHGINYYFISLYGQQRAVWAIVYYLMHLLKGLLLFGVIILIGTGWTFFKNFLTDRDRKLFMIVIPLQVLDNVALIIREESEIGLTSYNFWLKIFILVDLVCCAAVILPVIWSVRHLQEASRTDGKAAFNLKKLKLFRHFYIIVICYINLTRIVNYLVVFAVPFKHSYIVVLVVELSSWFFYVLTGYKFKPAANNPYLKFAVDEDDDEADDILLQSGALENVVRVNRAANVKTKTAAQKNLEEIEMEQAFIDLELSHELD